MYLRSQEAIGRIFYLKGEVVSDRALGFCDVQLSVSRRNRFFVSITDILLTAVLLPILFRTCAVI